MPHRASFLPVVGPFVLAFIALFGAGCAGRAPLPPQAVQLNQRGVDAMLASDLSAAESRFSLALEYNPRFTEAWVNLGWVALHRGNLVLAESHFERARSLNENLPTPHHGLGVLCERKGKLEAAEGHYRDALAVSPDFKEARGNLGRLLFARGAFDDARAQFLKLTDVAPNDASGFAFLAESLFKLGRAREAEDVILLARTRFGDTPEMLLLLARICLQRGDFAGAEEALAPVTQERDAGTAARAWAWTAVARFEARNFEGARAAVKEALAFDPTDAVALDALRRVEHVSARERLPRQPVRR